MTKASTREENNTDKRWEKWTGVKSDSCKYVRQQSTKNVAYLKKRTKKERERDRRCSWHGKKKKKNTAGQKQMENKITNSQNTNTINTNNNNGEQVQTRAFIEFLWAPAKVILLL